MKEEKIRTRGKKKPRSQAKGKRFGVINRQQQQE